MPTSEKKENLKILLQAYVIHQPDGERPWMEVSQRAVEEASAIAEAITRRIKSDEWSDKDRWDDRGSTGR